MTFKKTKSVRLPFLDEIARILASQVDVELLSKQAETYH